MKNLFFNISNKDNIPVISITGIIGKDADYAGFRNAIMKIADTGAKRVKLLINSGGGSMIDGFAIYDLLTTMNMTVEIEIIGMAASMGGILTQAASPGLCGIHENACVMTHQPQSGSAGESNAHRAAADFSDKLLAKAKAIFVKRGVKEETMKDWFQPGIMKWFTAEEAVAAGICDYIIKSDKKIKPNNSFTNEMKAYEFYNSLNTENQNPTKMNKLLVSVVLMLNNAGITNVTIDSTEEDVVKALNVFNASQATKVTNLETQIANTAKTRAADLIENAITAKKLIVANDVDKNKWIARAEKDYDMVKDVIDAVPAPVIDINSQLSRKTDAEMAAEKGTATNVLPAERSKWTMEQYEQNDPAALRNMLTSNLPEYKKLFKAQYGTEYPG
jgi:ATP-dependent protease ClpP protease subunit